MHKKKYLDITQTHQKKQTCSLTQEFFTATLGGKNFLTRQQVFSNWAANDGCAADLENILQS